MHELTRLPERKFLNVFLAQHQPLPTRSCATQINTDQVQAALQCLQDNPAGTEQANKKNNPYICCRRLAKSIQSLYNAQLTWRRKPQIVQWWS